MVQPLCRLKQAASEAFTGLRGVGGADCVMGGGCGQLLGGWLREGCGGSGCWLGAGSWLRSSPFLQVMSLGSCSPPTLPYGLPGTGVPLLWAVRAHGEGWTSGSLYDAPALRSTSARLLGRFWDCMVSSWCGPPILDTPALPRPFLCWSPTGLQRAPFAAGPTQPGLPHS